MIPGRGAAVLGLLLAASGCGTARPVETGLAASLETVPLPEDAAALLEVEGALASGRAEEALALAAPLAGRNPECARIPLLVHRSLGLLAAREALEEEGGEETRNALSTAWIARYPEGGKGLSGATALYARALFSGAPAERIALCRKALALEPSHYPALVLLGESLWRLGEVREAGRVLKRAVGLKRDLAEGWLLLARLAHEQGFFKTAGRHFRTYLGLRPFDRLAARDLLRLLVHELHRGAEAESLARDLLSRNEGDVDLRLDLGAALWLQGKHREAADLYFGILKAHPGEARAALNLGNLYYEVLHDEVRALQTYRWLERMPLGKDPHALLGQLLFVPTRIKKLRKALTAREGTVPPPPGSLGDLRPPKGPEDRARSGGER